MGESKIVAESMDDVGIRSGPGEDRLLVVAHPKDISVSLRQLANDAVLNRAQVLKLVYQHVVPPAAELGARGGIGPQEPLGQNDQIVEVGQIAIAQTFLVASQQRHAAFPKQPTLYAVKAEQCQDLGPSLFRHPQSLEHSQLVLLICHAETGTQTALLGKIPQHLEAQAVESPPSDVLRGVPPCFAEPQGDFLSRLVGERDGQDPARGNSERMDEVLDAADQTIGLAGAGSGHDQHRTQRGFDGTPLLNGGLETHASAALPLSARAQATMASASSSMTCSGDRAARLGTPNEWSAPSTRCRVASDFRRLVTSVIRSSRANPSRVPWRKSMGTSTD